MRRKRRRQLTAMDARACAASGGSQCPYSGSDAISGGDCEVDLGGAWQHDTCDACNAAWREVYVVSGIDVLDQRGRYRAMLDGTPGPVKPIEAAGLQRARRPPGAGP
jgi:hypothetical protein